MLAAGPTGTPLACCGPQRASRPAASRALLSSLAWMPLNAKRARLRRGGSLDLPPGTQAHPGRIPTPPARPERTCRTMGSLFVDRPTGHACCRSRRLEEGVVRRVRAVRPDPRHRGAQDLPTAGTSMDCVCGCDERNERAEVKPLAGFRRMRRAQSERWDRAGRAMDPRHILLAGPCKPSLSSRSPCGCSTPWASRTPWPSWTARTSRGTRLPRRSITRRSGRS